MDPHGVTGVARRNLTSRPPKSGVFPLALLLAVVAVGARLALSNPAAGSHSPARAAGSAAHPDPHIVINEVYARPPDRTQPLRFVELYNPAAIAVDVSGWRLAGDAFAEIPAGTFIAPQGFLVLAENPYTLRHVLALSDTAGWLLGPMRHSLSGENDFIRLLDASGLEIDVWSITTFPPWPMEIKGQGLSLERISPRGGSLDPSNWRACIAPEGVTPGQSNSVAAETPPPFVWDLRIDPPCPAPLEPVYIEARIAGDDHAVSATAVLQIGSETWTLPLSPLAEEPAADSRPLLGGKPVGRWGALMEGYSTGTIVLVSAEVRDSWSNLCRPWPDYPNWHSEGFMAGEAPTTPTLAAQWRFQMDWRRFRLLEKNPLVQGLSVPAGVFVQQEFFPHAWVSLRGRSSRTHPEKSFRITLSGDRRFPDGRGTVYLKSQWTDPSLIRERLAWEVVDCLNLPALEITPALLWINSWFYGVVTDVELPTDPWMEREGLDPEGALVRVDYGLYPLSGLTRILPTVLSSLRRAEEEPAAFDRMAFQFMDMEYKDSGPVIHRHFEVDSLVTTLLAQALLNDRDARFINRMYYHPPAGSSYSGGKWTLLPWDLDLTFGRYATPSGDFRQADLLIDSPALDWRGQTDALLGGACLSLDLRDHFYRRLEEAVGACFQDEQLEPFICDWTDDLGEWGAADRLRWEPGGVPGAWDEQPQRLLDFINLRRHFLLAYDRRQYYRAPIDSPEDLIFPAGSGFRDVEAFWRNLAPDWRRAFPVAEWLRRERWSALPPWAESAVAARQALNRLLPSFPLLTSTPPGDDSPSRFETARAFGLIALSLLLLWVAAASPVSLPRKEKAGRTTPKGSALLSDAEYTIWQWAGRGFAAGLGWLVLAATLSGFFPASFPRPLPADWISFPFALGLFAVALSLGPFGICASAPLRWPLGLLLGIFFFSGLFSPVSVSVFQPGYPGLVAAAVGVGVYLALRRSGTTNAKGPGATGKRIAGVAILLLGALAAYLSAGGSRPDFLNIPAEVWATAAGAVAWLFMRKRDTAAAIARAVLAGLVALVVWHLAGDHLALLATFRKSNATSAASGSSILAFLRIEARVCFAALAASFLSLAPALICASSSASCENRRSRAIRISTAFLVFSLVAIAALGSALMQPQPFGSRPLSPYNNEAEFERKVRGGVLTRPAGFSDRVENAFATWYQHLDMLGEAPSRRPLLAAEVLGAAGDRDAALYAHTMLIHRNPWMLGEALAAQCAIGKPLVEADATWLRGRIDKGALDLKFRGAGAFEACLARRLRDQIEASTQPDLAIPPPPRKR